MSETLIAELREQVAEGWCLCHSAHTDWNGVAALLDSLDALTRLHRRVPVCIAWEDCLRGEHDDDETQDGDQICRTCEPLFYVCDHCWDEASDRGEWPCETAALLATPPTTPEASA